jgi:hypothetical protein
VSVAAASTPCAARRSSAEAAPNTAERTSGWKNRTRAPTWTRPASCAGPAAPGSIPARALARHSSAASPAGSAAASSTSRRVGSGSSSSRRRKLSSIRPGSPAVPPNPGPPASSAGVMPRGSSSSASGFPAVSATIRSITV